MTFLTRTSLNESRTSRNLNYRFCDTVPRPTTQRLPRLGLLLYFPLVVAASLGDAAGTYPPRSPCRPSIVRNARDVMALQPG